MNAVILLALAGALLAQSPPLAFDAATIKPTDPASTAHGLNLAIGGRTVEIAGFTLSELIQKAYDLAGFQISGGRPFIDSQRYDITAKAVSEAPIGLDRFALLLQQLLADRFALRIHRETKELPAYSLTIAKKGVKLHEGTAPETNFDMSRGRIKADMVPMSMLARILGRYMGRPVIDRTGLKGNYNFRLDWTPGDTEGDAQPAPGAIENAAPSDPSGPSIFTALQEQLGLKLVSAKSPVEVIVIDHVEKPSEN